MTKLPFEHFLEIEWEDAASNDGWADKDTDLSPEIIISRGWLVKSEQSYITLANSIHQDSDHQFGGTQTITRAMIVQCKELIVAKKNKRIIQRASKKKIYKKGTSSSDNREEISESEMGTFKSQSDTK